VTAGVPVPHRPLLRHPEPDGGIPGRGHLGERIVDERGEGPARGQAPKRGQARGDGGSRVDDIVGPGPGRGLGVPVTT
jgi:hypothetical protein